MPIQETSLSIGRQQGDQSSVPDIAGNLSAGIKTGMQLASVQDQLDSQKMQVQQQKMELQQKQATALMNRMTGALFAPNDKIAQSAIDSTQSWANQSQVAFNGEGFKQIISDPELKLHAQRAMTTLRSGGVLNQQQISELLSFSSAQAPEMAETILSLNAENSKTVNKNAQETKIEGMKIAGDLGKAHIMADAATGRLDTRNQAIYDRILKQADTETQPKITQIQNLQNAISNLNSSTPTPESFYEVQQAVRSNLGIKGNPGVENITKTMMGAAGVDAAHIVQFLTASPQDVTKYIGDPMLDHFKSLANNEIQNASAQVKAAVDKHKQANASFFAAHPQLRGDMDNYTQSRIGQTSVGQSPSAAPANDQQAKIDKAKAAGYSDAEIKAYLQGGK